MATAARVLVANDDPGAAELLRRLLARAGHDVTVSDSRVAALAALNDVRPECVVLDLFTGGISENLALLDVLRTHPDHDVAMARVVVIEHASSDPALSWTAGADAVLVRPFRADELVAAVAEVMARPQEERRAHRHEAIREAPPT